MPKVLSEDLSLTLGAADSSEVPGRDDSTALSAVGGDGQLFIGVPGLFRSADER